MEAVGLRAGSLRSACGNPVAIRLHPHPRPPRCRNGRGVVQSRCRLYPAITVHAEVLESRQPDAGNR